MNPVFAEIYIFIEKKKCSKLNHDTQGLDPGMNFDAEKIQKDQFRYKLM